MLQRLGDIFSDWSSPGSIRVFPRQAILFSRRANDSLRVLVHGGTIVLFRRVLFLGIDIAAANLENVQLVRADAPEQNFFAARLGIEIPFSFSLDHRNRKRPFIDPDRKSGAL